LIDRAGSAVGQVDSPFIKQCQRVLGGLRVDLADIALQCCDTGRSRVDAVSLASAAAGEFPDPCGYRRRDIHNDLAQGQQPQRQVVSETVGVFDPPGPFGPGLRPDNQTLVFGEGCLDAQ